MVAIDADKNITIIRGDSADFEIELLEDDGEGGTQPYVLKEGDDITLTVKKTTKTSEVLIQKHGQVIHLDTEDTSMLNYGTYKYDVQFTRADGYVDTVIPPKNFKITEEVTW